MTSPLAPLLELRNIETCYGPLQALFGVSLRVKTGTVVALLGANGAGKSTILKTIAGLLRDQPDKGVVQFKQERLNGLETSQIVSRGIAYVPEGREVFPELTVRENLNMGAYLRTSRREVQDDAERMQALFPVLRTRASQLAGTLSGGEQQMLAIARGLMSRPELLLLDEPSLGLAPTMVKEIFRIVRTINRQGTAILLVEQNARMALEVADHGYVVENGRMVMDDTAAALLGNRDIQEFYLGMRAPSASVGERRYKRKKRWR